MAQKGQFNAVWKEGCVLTLAVSFRADEETISGAPESCRWA